MAKKKMDKIEILKRIKEKGKDNESREKH